MVVASKYFIQSEKDVDITVVKQHSEAQIEGFFFGSSESSSPQTENTTPSPDKEVERSPLVVRFLPPPRTLAHLKVFCHAYFVQMQAGDVRAVEQNGKETRRKPAVVVPVDDKATSEIAARGTS